MSDTPTPLQESSILSIKMPVEMRQRIEDLAAKEERTASQVVRFYLRQALGMNDEPSADDES